MAKSLSSKSRHLAFVTDEEFEALQTALGKWLRKYDVAGSHAGQYSLYTALDECRAEAKATPIEMPIMRNPFEVRH